MLHTHTGLEVSGLEKAMLRKTNQQVILFFLFNDFNSINLRQFVHEKIKHFTRAHEQFGYCQAGTSAVLTSEDRVVIGTPGPYTWRGTLYLFTVSDEFLTRDNNVYNAPMQDSSPVNKYSYLGNVIYIKYSFCCY